jgi:hypothetical protein
MEMMDTTMRLFAPHMEQLMKRGRELFHEMIEERRSGRSAPDASRLSRLSLR